MTEGTLGTVKIKVEEIEYFCYGCLSSDRRLTVLRENTDLFVYLLGRTCVSEHTNIPLCWECSAILRNTRRFQQRIRRAHDLMQLQQTLYQQQTLQSIIAGDPIKFHLSLHTKTFDPDHYDLCIEHTDTQTDINIADVEIKNEVDDFKHEESLNDEVHHSQEDPISLSPSTRNDTVTYSNTSNTYQQNKIENIESTVHGAAFNKQLIVLLERIDEKENVQVKYENMYDSDIDIDEVDIEAGLDKKEECSAQDTNIEHQLNKHDENSIENGIDSDDCESNVSERSFSEREMESFSDTGPPGKKFKPSDDNETRREEKIEVLNVKHVAEKHLKTGTKSKLYKCNYCEKTFISKNKLNLHLKNLTRSVKCFICETCDKTFKQRRVLITHLRTHTGEKPYSCKICDKKFTDHGNLKTHSRIHTGEKLYNCHVCSKRFTHHSNLKKHSRIHTGEKPYSCPLCDKKFTQLNALKSHSRIHTGQKPFSCEICKKKFTQHGSLKIHSRIHTGENRYSCKLCDKKFTHQSSLNNHFRIHTGEKPYSCKSCDKKFTVYSNFKRHSRIHTGEKHSCPLCDKKFTQLDALKRHSRIHTGEKPFSCEICKKNFSQHSSFKIHSRIHTGEKPYSCDVCCKRFMLKGSLKRHLNTHNSEKPHSSVHAQL